MEVCFWVGDNKFTNIYSSVLKIEKVTTDGFEDYAIYFDEGKHFVILSDIEYIKDGDMEIRDNFLDYLNKCSVEI